MRCGRDLAGERDTGHRVVDGAAQHEHRGMGDAIRQQREILLGVAVIGRVKIRNELL